MARFLSERGGLATALYSPALPAASKASKVQGPPAWPANTKRCQASALRKKTVSVGRFVVLSKSVLMINQGKHE